MIGRLFRVGVLCSGALWLGWSANDWWSQPGVQSSTSEMTQGSPVDLVRSKPAGTTPPKPTDGLRSKDSEVDAVESESELPYPFGFAGGSLLWLAGGGCVF